MSPRLDVNWFMVHLVIHIGFYIGNDIDFPIWNLSVDFNEFMLFFVPPIRPFHGPPLMFAIPEAIPPAIAPGNAEDPGVDPCVPGIGNWPLIICCAIW